MQKIRYRRDKNMTEQQRKAFAKWCLDNGHRKLTKEEKEAIKSAMTKQII